MPERFGAVSLLKKEAAKLLLAGWLQTNWEKLLARAALQGREGWQEEGLGATPEISL